ncbi:MAG TPA: hypothetical protein PLO37_14515 [Candidatus Hydrogenedentes bacterium]|nr:hypothetical protein [Candidatus Hydrogenedentota bacterium]HPG68060.1 hypothetical protein [Candidatus Hydrogenedentota bacterium]
MTGSLPWMLFAVIAVAVRGVRWDEVYERAQIITGMVPYPKDHPLYHWSVSAPCIWHDLGALLVRLTHGPLAVCTWQSLLHVMAAVLPVYLLAAVLSRRILVGHCAAVFVLFAVHLDFHSYYPLSVWPERFTIAHIALGCALLVLLCLSTERYRLGALLLGLMPMIHLGHTPVLVVMAGLFGLRLLWRGEKRILGGMVVWGLAGAALSAGYLLFKHGQTPPPLGLASPFYSAADATEAWRRYTLFTDVHRAYPRFGPFLHTNFALVGMLLIGAGAARMERRQRGSAGPWYWVWLYTVLLSVLVWSILMIQNRCGDAIPFALVGWMPHRLPNQVIVLFLAATTALAGSRFGEQGRGARWLLAAGLGFLAVKPLVALVLPSAFYAAYVEPPGMVLFVLAGGALGSETLAWKGDWRWKGPWLAAVLLALGALALCHQAGLLCVIAGMLGAGLSWFVTPRHVAERGLVAVLAGLGLVCSAEVLWREGVHREHLPVKPVYREVTAYLEQAGESDAMLVSSGRDIDLQMCTGHPVLVTYETQALASYIPSLAAGIEKLYTDLYGYRFGKPWHYDLEVWRARPRAEWQQLAEHYRFHYVLSPEDVPLDLDPVLEGDGLVFYQVPKEDGTSR